VEDGLFKSHTEITNRPGIFRTTWTDAWGRVREIHEPGAAGGTDETTITYSPPGDPVQRVLVVDAADRHMLSEYEPSTGIRREGIDVDGNGQLGAGDRFTTTTPTIAGGEIKIVTTTTGEGDPLMENTYNPASGATTTKSAGGAATLTSTTNWNTKTSTTASTDGWSSTSSFNNLGLTTGGSTTGTGIPAISTSRDLRADGSVEHTSLTIGGETTSASFAPNGLLTDYTDPVLGIRSVDHGIANGSESLSIGGQTSITSLDGTSSAISGPNIFARGVSTGFDGQILQTTIDPEDGASTTLTLNDAGLKTEHGYAAGHKPTTTWNPGGLPASISTGLGNIGFNYSANGARDLTGITFPTFGPNAGSGSIGFTYDEAGRIATLSDDTGTRTFAWSFGHPVSETWDTGPAILRPLDGKRRLQETQVKNGATTLITTTPDYNGDSRELDSISTDGFTATFTRDPATRRITSIERGNVTQTFGRDPQAGGRITSATSNVTGAPSFAYPNHDAQGRRTAANTNRGNWSYTYRGGVNGDGQLAEADHTGDWSFEYEQDGIGRRLSFKMPGGIEQFQTGNANDPLNQFLSTQWRQQMLLRASLDREADVEITQSFALPTLLPGLEPDPEEPPLRDIVFPLTPPGPQGGWTAWSITGTLEGGGDPGAAPHRKAKLAGLALFPPAQETFTYDDAGNRSSSARWLYTYDGLNRLTRAVNKDLATAPEAWDVEFTYDAEGRRHSKTSKLYRDGVLRDTTITTWIWDGWHPVIERVIDAKLNQPIVERKLVWGPDLSGQLGGAGGAGGLLLIRETNHTFDGRPPVTTDLLPLYDGSGNIVGLANPQGDLLAEYWYGPFGELLEATGSHADTNPWRWASKSLDPETGLVYFGLRYYDPATGQWLSREPLGEGESLNLYAYCHNDPINRVDVLGAAQVMLSTPEPLPEERLQAALWWLYDHRADIFSGNRGLVFKRPDGGYGKQKPAGFDSWTSMQMREFLTGSGMEEGQASQMAKLYLPFAHAQWEELEVRERWARNDNIAMMQAMDSDPLIRANRVADDFRTAFWHGSGADSIFVMLGGSHYTPWIEDPGLAWQEATLGERAWATVESFSYVAPFARGGKLGQLGKIPHRQHVPRNLVGANRVTWRSGGSGLMYPRTAGLGPTTTTAELMASGALPGIEGVTLAQRSVRFGDLHQLSILGGREVEFALTRESGAFRLYSGGAGTVATPSGARVIGHTHPGGTMLPSATDINSINNAWLRQLSVQPYTPAVPSRVIWGGGNAENTIFWPSIR
jgi:RHS repeat-associated protein